MAGHSGSSRLTMLGDIQDSVRSASAEGRKLRITGRDTWSAAHMASVEPRDLSLAAYSGVHEYVPGDLTITVRAGTSLSEISELTGAENQWLPLDPFGSTTGTIGATVATCSFGPLVTGFGSPRDLVLGVEAVMGTGDVVRAGGRVVKNVAGYDLSRLLTGSWGSLGAISEVTMRLFAKQESESSIALALPGKRESAAQLISALRAASIHPWAMELLDAATAVALGLDAADVLVFRFGGNEKVVRSQINTVQSLGTTHGIGPEFWKALQDIQHAWSLRISSLPSRLFQTWDQAGELVAATGKGFRSATPERGIVRLYFPEGLQADQLKAEAKRFVAEARHAGMRIVIEAIPGFSPLNHFSENEPARRALNLGIKKVFDPMNVLNPGLFPQ